MVEHLLAKEKVVGSTPISRSIRPPMINLIAGGFLRKVRSVALVDHVCLTAKDRSCANAHQSRC